MTAIELTTFDQDRREIHTAVGPVSYIDTGGGLRPAVFVHGVGTSSYLWRNLVPLLSDSRRCIVPDLPLHGHTPLDPDQDVSLSALASFVIDTVDALGLDDIDLIANDTGGAVAQIVATRIPGRLRTLTLTNCEAHDNVPPKAFRATVLLARAGLLAGLLRRQVSNIPKARKRIFGSGYQNVEHLPEAVVEAFMRPLLGTRAQAHEFQRWIASLRAEDLLAIEPQLRELEVPTLIAWGTDDVFFHRRWAEWLRDTIPGAGEITWIEGGRLFLPDERAADLAPAILRHWEAADR